MPRQLAEQFDEVVKTEGVTKSEFLRGVIEREVLEARQVPGRKYPRYYRRLRLRRCISCGAFVRRGYTCKTCRLAAPDRVIVSGVVVPNPLLPRPRLHARPDVRDPKWVDAEAVILEALSPLVGIVYEYISGADALEVTDLDDVADVLAMASSLVEQET